MPETNGNGKDLISLLHRSTGEPSGFADLISSWNALFQGSDHLPKDAPPIDEIERAARQALGDERAGAPAGRFISDVPRLLNKFAHAAFLVDRNGFVRASNRAALEQFGEIDDQSIKRIGISLEGAEPIDETVRKTLVPGRNSLGPVLKRAFEQDTERPLSISIVPVGMGAESNAMALVFVIDPTVHVAATAMIEREFALTEAESEILTEFVNGNSLKEIARKRNRAHATLRTQFQAILNKSGARTQVDLVRNTLAVSEFVKEADGLSEALRHPDRKTLNVVRPGGRSIEITLAGDPNGKPVIFVPSFTLYTFPNMTETSLRQAGICMISVCRPGFGATDRCPDHETAERCLADDISAVMRQLEIDRCPFLTHSSAAPYSFQLGAMMPEKITRIVCLSGFVPRSFFEASETSSVWAAALARTSAQSAAFRKLLVVGGMKMLKVIGSKRFIAMQLSANSPDAKIFRSPEFLSQFDNAIHAALANGYDAILDEVALSSTDWGKLVAACKSPVVYLQGTKDTFMTPQTLRKFAGAFSDVVEVEEVHDAAELLMLTHTNKLIQTLYPE